MPYKHTILTAHPRTFPQQFLAPISIQTSVQLQKQTDTHSLTATSKKIKVKKVLLMPLSLTAATPFLCSPFQEVFISISLLFILCSPSAASLTNNRSLLLDLLSSLALWTPPCLCPHLLGWSVSVRSAVSLFLTDGECQGFNALSRDREEKRTFYWWSPSSPGL